MTVDVNEQNPAARGFYQALGFTVVGRSPLDDDDRPFPRCTCGADTSHGCEGRRGRVRPVCCRFCPQPDLGSDADIRGEKNLADIQARMQQGGGQRPPQL